MAKVKYIYNTKTCKHEPVSYTGKQVAFNILGLFGAAIAMAALLVYIYQNNFTTVKESHLLAENERLKLGYKALEERVSNTRLDIAELQIKDDSTYRTILDLTPIPTEVRKAGIGGSDKYQDLKNSNLSQENLIIKSYKAIDEVKKQLYVQALSFDEIEKEEKAKEVRWASRPAIQPIHNKELKRIASGFKLIRYHPILKMNRPHKGLDFTASRGTNVYATGDGVVKRAQYSKSFGNVIYIDHGFGYETRYAHLHNFNIKVGQKVKRGDVIGFVGNTGLSVSSHLHYEIHYKGVAIDPINFFHRDLSNEQYESLIEHSENSTVILD